MAKKQIRHRIPKKLYFLKIVLCIIFVGEKVFFGNMNDNV